MFDLEYPSASRRDAAHALKLSESNIWAAFHRLYRRDLSRYCPACFQPRLFNGACQDCGFESSEPLSRVHVDADSQSPTNSLHPGDMLGSEVDYLGGRDAEGRRARIGFSNYGELLRRQMEKTHDDPLIRAVKSDVENELKRSYPSEAVSDEAGRLVEKEVFELRAKYPGLASSKNARGQLVQNVVNRLLLLHPQLRHLTILPQDVD